MAAWIKSDGTWVGVTPTNGSDFSLSELQGYVGGLFELVDISTRFKGMWMVVNEEGMLLNLPYNELAASLHGFAIMGNVLICNKNEIL